MDRLSFTKGKMDFIRNAMSYTGTRILIMIFFFLFIYQIIYAIGVFFAINTMVLSMWLCWLAMFVLFVSFLPVRNGMFYVKVPEIATIGAAAGATVAGAGALVTTGAAAGATVAGAGAGATVAGAGA
jgi:hypothetical protein